MRILLKGLRAAYEAAKVFPRKHGHEWEVGYRDGTQKL